MTMTKEQIARLEGLRREAQYVVDKINTLVDALVDQGDEDVITTFHQLPSVEKLDEIEAFARSFTRDPKWGPASPMDKAYLTEVRCTVSDGVAAARELNYVEANKCIHRAIRRLHHVRTRNRTGKWATMPPEINEALTEAAQVLSDVLLLFIDADIALSRAQGVIPGVTAS